MPDYMMKINVFSKYSCSNFQDVKIILTKVFAGCNEDRILYWNLIFNEFVLKLEVENK